MFFKSKKEDKKNTEPVLITKLLGPDYNKLIRPELYRFINSIDENKLNTPDEIETFINNFTVSRALNTNRYLFIYLIEPETRKFIKSIVYDKYTDKIDEDETNIYTFRYNNEKQKISVGKDNKIISLDFYRFGFNIYGLLLTYNTQKKIYNVSLWTNFLPKFISIFNINDTIFKKNLNILTKITLLKQLVENKKDLEIIPARVNLFYHPFLNQILVSYIFQVDEYTVSINTEFFKQDVKEAYYKDPYNDVIKLL